MVKTRNKFMSRVRIKNRARVKDRVRVMIRNSQHATRVREGVEDRECRRGHWRGWELA